MEFAPPPPTAAWRHVEARSGFEVVYLGLAGDTWRIEGCTTALDDGQTWAVDYAVELDRGWTTRRARISGRSGTGLRSLALEADGEGHWLVDGKASPHLDGCLDVDLESSAVTNALPVHRLALPVGGRAEAPGAYVRALDLAVERLEQTYGRLTNEGPHQRYDYTAPAFGVACRLVYDESGLVLDYPGLAVRAG